MKNAFSYWNIFSPKNSLISTGILLLALCIISSCKKDPVQEMEAVSPVDAVLGVHTKGTCYYYNRYLNMMNGQWIEVRDTFYNCTLNLTRLNSNSVQAEGYGANLDPWLLPSNSTDTIFDLFAVHHSTIFTMKIDLTERTIKTHSHDSGAPGPPNYKQYDGFWKY